MRKYLLPAMKYASRALPQPSDLRVFMIKRRTIALSMVISFLVVTAMGMIAVSATMKNDNQNIVKYEDHAEGETSTTSTATDSPQKINEGAQKSPTEANTNITLNGEPIGDSDNSNYSKTITTEHGTTHVNVSSNSGSAGEGFTSSTSTTHMSVSGNSFTNDVQIHTSQ